MQFAHDIRAGQAKDVVVPLELAGMVPEPLGPVVGFAEPAFLEHHAPGPVEDQDAVLRGLLQDGDAFAARAHAAVSLSVGVSGSRTPSTRQMA